MSRLSWQEYSLKLAIVASERSEDPYVKVGACCLRYDKSCASIAYSGAVSGIEIDWSDRDERRKRVIHAEQNALRYVKPGEVWLLACTLLPCRSCLQTIASYGIKYVVYRDLYDKDDFSLTLAEEYDIKLEQISL